MNRMECASWICAPRKGEGTPCFRREFELEENANQATIYMCGLGHFSLFVNGEEVNAGVIEPAWTDYAKTCYYSSYSLGNYVKKGRNDITVLLGNGMYYVSGTDESRMIKFRNSFGEPALIAQLDIVTEAGENIQIVTDKTWMTAQSPIVFSCVYGGEEFDNRLSAWRKPVYQCPEAWNAAEFCKSTLGVLKPALQPPVKIHNEYAPIMEKRLSEDKVLYDFGRNFAGRVKICVKGKAGEKVKITTGELLSENGEINQEYSGDSYCVYILSGEGEEKWMPRFTYYGMRYAVVETSAEILTVRAYDNYADCRRQGYFRCSNPLYNDIHTIIVRAIESNMQSLFTDCPHREKFGWLEQLHLVGKGVLCNFDALALMEKALYDMEDAQLENGLVPDTSPEYEVLWDGFRDSPEWGSACILLLLHLYQKYGDADILARHYDVARRYLKYLLSKAEDGILSHGLGDWGELGHDTPQAVMTPCQVTATSMLYLDLRAMKTIAEVLKKVEDAKEYQREAAKVKEAFHKELFDAESLSYGNGSQASNALALYLDVVPLEHRNTVIKHLIEDIHAHDLHFTGGDVGHPFILRALSAIGRDDVIAANLNLRTFPSYGYMLECGATTLLEHWDSADPEKPFASQNHFMLGAAEEWFFEHLAGIRIDMPNKQVIFEPYFAESVDSVECATGTPYGLVEVKWSRCGNEVKTQVKIPRELKLIDKTVNNRE